MPERQTTVDVDKIQQLAQIETVYQDKGTVVKSVKRQKYVNTGREGGQSGAQIKRSEWDGMDALSCRIWLQGIFPAVSRPGSAC